MTRRDELLAAIEKELERIEKAGLRAQLGIPAVAEFAPLDPDLLNLLAERRGAPVEQPPLLPEPRGLFIDVPGFEDPFVQRVQTLPSELRAAKEAEAFVETFPFGKLRPPEELEPEFVGPPSPIGLQPITPEDEALAIQAFNKANEGAPPTTTGVLGGIFEGLDKVIGLPRRAVVAAVELATEGQPQPLIGLLTGVPQPELGARIARDLSKTFEETSFTKATQPFVRAIASSGDIGKSIVKDSFLPIKTKLITGVVGEELAKTFRPDAAKEFEIAQAKTDILADQSLTEEEVRERVRQLGPVMNMTGLVNFVGDVGLSLDWFLGSGLTKTGIILEKLGKLRGLTLIEQAKLGARAPLVLGGQALVTRQGAINYYSFTNRLAGRILGPESTPGIIRRIGGAFNKSIRPGGRAIIGVENRVQEVFFEESAKINNDAVAMYNTLIRVARENDIPLSEMNKFSSDLAETFGREFKDDTARLLTEFGNGPKITGPFKIQQKEAQFAGMVESAMPFVNNDVEAAKGIANVTQTMFDVGVDSLATERAAGLTIQQLSSNDINYLLHLVSGEASQKLGWRSLVRGKAAAILRSEKGVDALKPISPNRFKDDALLSDIFHPSLEKRAIKGTVKQGNDLAEGGQIYAWKGKVLEIKEGAKPPRGATRINKLWEDNPANLFYVRKMRTLKSVTALNFLKKSFDAVERREGGITLKQIVTKGGNFPDRFQETFGRLSPELQALTDIPVDPQIATAMIESFHRYKGIEKLGKHPAIRTLDKFLNIWKPITIFPFAKYYARNQVGAMWNSYLGDALFSTSWVDSLAFDGRMSAHPQWREFVEDGMIGISQSTGDIEQGLFFGAGLKSLHIGSLTELQENYIRFSNYLHYTNNGYIRPIAALKTKQIQFDYLDLTPFEWNVMRRIMPFYTWTRKNVPLQLNKLAEKPARFLGPTRGVKGFSEKRSEIEKTQLRGSFVGERLPIKLGKGDIALEDWWPGADILKLTRGLDEAGQIMGPHIKLPYELWAKTVDGLPTVGWGPFGPGEPTGFSTFTKRPIDTGKKKTIWGVPVNPKLAFALKSMFRFFREVEKPFEEDTSTLEKQLQFLGIPYYERNEPLETLWAIIKLDSEQKSINPERQPEKWKKVQWEKIGLHGLLDKTLDPFRGTELLASKNEARAAWMFQRTGVDIKSLITDPRLQESVELEGGTKTKLWELEAARRLPFTVEELDRFGRMYPEATSEEHRVMAFKQMFEWAGRDEYLRGGEENFQKALTEITTMRSNAEKGIIKLADDEWELLREVYLNVLMKRFDYFNEATKTQDIAAEEYSGKVKGWVKSIEQTVGGSFPEGRLRYNQIQVNELDTRIGLADMSDDDDIDKILGFISDRIGDDFIPPEQRDEWVDRFVQYTGLTLSSKISGGAKADLDKAATRLRSLIKDVPGRFSRRQDVREQYLLQYINLVDFIVSNGLGDDSRWDWFGDNSELINPLLQGLTTEEANATR